MINTRLETEEEEIVIGPEVEADGDISKCSTNNTTNLFNNKFSKTDINNHHHTARCTDNELRAIRYRHNIKAEAETYNLLFDMYRASIEKYDKVT